MKIKLELLLKWYSQIAQWCSTSPRLWKFAFLFHPTPKASFWWRCRYGEYKSKLASHILLSQKPDPKDKQVINLDQDVQVCGNIYFWLMVDELLCMNHLPLVSFSFLWIGAIFFSLFLSFFWHALWVCGIPSLGMHLLFWTCRSVWHTFFGYASFIPFFLHSPISFV